jgi:transcription initiation factor IIF auxiliary subunit
MMNVIRFENYSMLTSKKHDASWYEWCIFVNEDRAIINAIDSVEYTLHPTFPDPIRLVKDKTSRFALFSAGWGEFLVNILVAFTDGSSLNTTHYLRFSDDNWPKKIAPQDFGDNETKIVYQTLFNEKFRWRRVDTGARNTNLPEERILDIYRRLEEDNLVRKAYYKSIDNKDLWGATAVVGISPRVL